MGRKIYRTAAGRRAAAMIPWHRAIPFPPSVSIEPTNACNFSCPACVRFHDKVREQGYMEFELFKEIIRELAGGPACDTLLTGFGEPLLHPEFTDFIDFASARGIRTLRIITNASLLTEEITDAVLSGGVSGIHFSIDGNSSETYNSIRKGGDFEKTLANVIRFLEARDKRNLDRPTVVLRTIRMDKTASEIDGIRARWQKLLRETDEIWIQELLSHDVENRLSRQDNEARKKAAHHGRRPVLSPCIVLFKHIGVRWNGDFEYCCASGIRSDFGLGLGFPGVSIRDAWVDPRMRKIRRLHLLGKKDDISICRSCGNHSFNAL